MPSHACSWVNRSLIPMMVCLLMVIGGLPLHATEGSHGLADSGTPNGPGPSFRAPQDLKIESQPRFIENRGQVANPAVLYYIIGEHMEIGFMNDGLVIVIEGAEGDNEGRTISPSYPSFDVEGQNQAYVVEFRFEGGLGTHPIGLGQIDGQSSFLLGNDPSRWALGVLTYRELIYSGIYKNIDLRFYFKERALKYDINLFPGADLDQVVFKYTGDVDIRIDPITGDALIGTPIGGLRDLHPISTQIIGAVSYDIPCSFRTMDGNALGFSVDGEYKVDEKLVIDPGFQYGTYLGGTDQETRSNIALDESGNVYVAGTTGSTDFPMVPGSYNKTNSGSYDGYVAVFDSTLSRLLYSTYFGGGEDDWIDRFTVGTDGCIYAVGHTKSTDFPVSPNAFCSTYHGEDDAFLFVLDIVDSKLLYSTFIGGAKDDQTWGVAIDSKGQVIIVGTTASGGFSDINSTYIGEQRRQKDCFVLKFYEDKSKVEFCTIIGGPKDDTPNGVVLMPDGSMIIAGVTTGSFPTTSGAYCASYANYGFFAMRLNASGDKLLFSTIGPHGESVDSLYAFTVDSRGNIYLVGGSNSTDFPTTWDAVNSSCDGYHNPYLVVLSDNGTRLSYSTFVHSDGRSEFRAISLNGKEDRLAMVGYTFSTDFPFTKGAFDGVYRDSASNGDGMLVVFNLTEMKITYSSYFGGKDTDLMSSVEFDGNNSVYFCGEVYSDDIYTSGDAFSSQYKFSGDTVIASIDPTPGRLPSVPLDFTSSPADWEIMLKWKRPSDEGGCRVSYYKVSRYNSAASEWEVIYQGYDFEYHDTDVNNGESYTYRVQAVSTVGESDYAELTARVPSVIPTVPRNLTARTGDGTVTLNWIVPAFDGGGRITNYAIMRGLTRDEMPEVARVGDETSWVDTAVELGTFYYYKVAAVNPAGIGPFTEAVRIKPV